MSLSKVKISVTTIASTLGLRILPFVNKKTGKEDAKKVCLSVPKGLNGEIQIAAFRAFTKAKPLGRKVGQTSFRVFFPASLMNKMMVVPSLSK